MPRFRAEHEEPVRVLPLTEIRPAAGRVSVRTHPGGDGAPVTVPRATLANPPVRCLPVVEDGGERSRDEKHAERQRLETIEGHGSITPVRAALETTLTVSEADRMLSDLAAGGHLEVRVEGRRLLYSM